MLRRLAGLLGAVALLAAGLGVTAAPASAAPNVTATSVALSEGADCGDASLELGLQVTTAQWERGEVTDLSGATLGSFEQAADWDGFDGVYIGWGLSPDDEQPDGTVMAAYAAVGNAPLSPGSAVEFIVLYRCGTDGANEVLLTCFGDLGTCPTTAVEAAAVAFGAEVSPTEVEPGETLTVTGTGCLYPLAGAVLTRDGAGLGVGDTVAPEGDGSFTIELVVPEGVTPGPLGVQVDCGYEGATVLQTVLAVQVPGEDVPTTTTTPTSSTSSTSTTVPGAAAARVVAPRFAG